VNKFFSECCTYVTYVKARNYFNILIDAKNTRGGVSVRVHPRPEAPVHADQGCRDREGGLREVLQPTDDPSMVSEQ